jgi:uncharacterized protein (UPF0264 family)
MQLLVSVRSAAEAVAAVLGGADLVDAKEPAAGPLGAVTGDTFRDIAAVVASARRVSAALGDAVDETAIEQSAGAFTAAGAAFVKVGFAGTESADRVGRVIAAAVRAVEDVREVAQGVSPAFAVAGLKSCAVGQVVAVAYADADRARSITRDRLVDAAARAGARGILLDTFDKNGGGLRELVAAGELAAWVAAAHAAGLFVALAGRLAAADLPFVCDAGADIAGVRGAACDGGRTDRVSADRVRLLRSACDVKPAEVP